MIQVGLNNHFKKMCSDLILKPNSLDGINIARSIKSITKNLHEYFEEEVDDAMVFGSYSRNTILPREYDKNSDVDILVLFATDGKRLRPESYREKLKKFALEFYDASKVIKDHPSIVIELDHINFDLVPGIFDNGFIYDSIEIPGKDGDWMETDPNKFYKDLIEVNTRYNSIVKPIVRILKYWNAVNEYPYHSSFELEKMIAGMNFSGENFESGFFYAVDELETWGRSDWTKQKVEFLRKHVSYMKEYLSNDDLIGAKRIVSRVFPHF